MNTTSLGMHGQPALEIDVARLPDDAVVTDLVYVPLQSALAAAKARGLKTADGLGMLLHQAVAASSCGLANGRRSRRNCVRLSRPISSTEICRDRDRALVTRNIYVASG